MSKVVLGFCSSQPVQVFISVKLDEVVHMQWTDAVSIESPTAVTLALVFWQDFSAEL